jgi:hypothetical protein
VSGVDLDRADGVPFFGRVVSARELELFFTPDSGEVDWAHEKVRSDEYLLALVLSLKCFSVWGTSRRSGRCRRWRPGTCARAWD